MRMAVIKLVIATAALCAAIVPVRAEVRILASPGGQVGPFIELFDRVRQSGERVVIDGPCLSACTLVLMMVPTERICVTRRAVLGFHAARSIDRARQVFVDSKDWRAVYGDARANDALRQPGFDFHGLRGRPQRFSIHFNGPWCPTFEWSDGVALRVDLEQYH